MLASAITFKQFIPLEATRITQIPATLSGCSKQCSLRQFSLIWVQECTKGPYDLDYIRTFASSLFLLKRNELKPVAALQLFTQNVSSVFTVHMTSFTDLIVWIDITTLFPNANNWIQTNAKQNFGILNGTCSAKLKQNA